MGRSVAVLLPPSTAIGYCVYALFRTAGSCDTQSRRAICVDSRKMDKRTIDEWRQYKLTVRLTVSEGLWAEGRRTTRGLPSYPVPLFVYPAIFWKLPVVSITKPAIFIDDYKIVKLPYTFLNGIV